MWAERALRCGSPFLADRRALHRIEWEEELPILGGDNTFAEQ
jgi:hypothetical protein